MFESLPCKLMWKSALDTWGAYTGKTYSSLEVRSAQTDNGMSLQMQPVAKLQGDSEHTCLPGQLAELSVNCASVVLTSEKETGRTTFRVTCARTGTKVKHTVSSMEVAKHFGSGIFQLFGWKVKLEHPDIEVLVSITDDDCIISILLTQDSRHLRNITHFGPTTLRSTIAYGLVRSTLQPLCLNINRSVCIE